jgi:hypothetical protein
MPNMPNTCQGTIKFGGKELLLPLIPLTPPLKAPSTSIILLELESVIFSLEACLLSNLESTPDLVPSETSKVRKHKLRTSYIFKYIRDKEFSADITNTEGKDIWHCRFYIQSYNVTNSTTNPSTYLRTYRIDSESIASIIVKNI